MVPVVKLEELPGTRVAVVRRRVPAAMLSRVVPECCGLVWNALRAQQIKPGRNVAIYWDGEIRLEVGAEIDVPFREEEGLVSSATPAGSTAIATHFGPYDQLGSTHRAIVEWCRAHGHRLAGPSWEIYGHWVDEWNTDPTKIRTDVFYQVAAS